MCRFLISDCHFYDRWLVYAGCETRHVHIYILGLMKLFSDVLWVLTFMEYIPCCVDAGFHRSLEFHTFLLVLPFFRS